MCFRREALSGCPAQPLGREPKPPPNLEYGSRFEARQCRHLSQQLHRWADEGHVSASGQPTLRRAVRPSGGFIKIPGVAQSPPLLPLSHLGAQLRCAAVTAPSPRPPVRGVCVSLLLRPPCIQRCFRVRHVLCRAIPGRQTVKNGDRLG